MTDALRALRDLGDSAPTYRADLPVLARAAVRRRRTRLAQRTLAGALALAVAGTGAVLVTDPRDERLSVPAAPAACAGQVTPDEQSALARAVEVLGLQQTSVTTSASCGGRLEGWPDRTAERVVAGLVTPGAPDLPEDPSVMVRTVRFDRPPAAEQAFNVAAAAAARGLPSGPGGEVISRIDLSGGSQVRAYLVRNGVLVAGWSPDGTVSELRWTTAAGSTPLESAYLAMAELLSEQVPPEEQPVEEQPVEEQPVEEQPVEEQPVEEPPAEEQPVEEPPADGTSSPTRQTDVFFTSGTGTCDRVAPVSRQVARSAPLRPALESLFEGPTAPEQAAGLSGFAVPGLLRSVRVDGAVVFVDLVADRFPGNATTSCGGASFTTTVEATVRAVVPDAQVVIALDGDPEAFVQALQGSCPEPASRGDRCDASGF